MNDLRDVLLVDGYNMIGSWPELVELAESSLQEARDRLLERLANYQAYSGQRVVAVFDAYRVPGLGKSYEQGRVELYFTKEKETADEAIERFVGQLRHRRRQIYVATSDMTEQHVIFGQGALRISARELLIEVQIGEREIRQRIKDQRLDGSRNTLDGKLNPQQRLMFEKWRRGE
ncbi:NYN domain-containing protein [Paenibacillus sp. WLX1005]|uniref:NYN domain-containing protein n=1 Tax=unclassified Paenibacillus TaxID=185978 RepID=UPI0039840B28